VIKEAAVLNVMSMNAQIMAIPELVITSIVNSHMWIGLGRFGSLRQAAQVGWGWKALLTVRKLLLLLLLLRATYLARKETSMRLIVMTLILTVWMTDLLPRPISKRKIGKYPDSKILSTSSSSLPFVCSIRRHDSILDMKEDGLILRQGLWPTMTAYSSIN
jgi:hypothetical protein